ncbi:hypothetical protein GW17_00042383 [Ensete ventricosum]|nr:hypothetical protein GW17_00042383 [Ensete ventricosum]
MGTDVLVSSARRSGFGPSVCRVGRGMWAWQPRCSRLGLVDGCSCDIGSSSSAKNVVGFWCRSRGVSMAWSLLSAQARPRQSRIRGLGWGWYDVLGVCITGRGPRAPSYWELHFGVRHNKKKSYGFKERISWYRRGGYSCGCRCKAKDSRAMSLAAPWYHKGGTSVESSIPCSHGGRALVVKGVEEVEYAKANSKYQDRTEGQRPRNFIRPVSMDFSSR